MNSTSIAVNTPVVVKWDETQSRFSGVVKALNADGTYDVVYDEKIDGKTCIETSVARSRIVSALLNLENYWNDPDIEPVSLSRKHSTQSIICESEYEEDNENPAGDNRADRNKLIASLLNAQEVAGSNEISSMSLNNLDAIALYHALTPTVVNSILRDSLGDSSHINILTALLSARIHRSCTQEMVPFADQWIAYITQGESKQRLNEWIRTTNSSAESPLNSSVAILCSAAGILRLHSAQLKKQQDEDCALRYAGSQAPAEETVLQAIQHAYTLLQINFHSFTALSAGSKDTKTGGTGMVSGKPSSAKANKKENLLGRVIAEVGKRVFPALSSMLTSIQESFSLSHASQRNVTAVLEMTLSVLKCDPISCPLLETLVVQQASTLDALHKVACSTVAQIFLLCPPQRKVVLAELLGMLNLTFSFKSPYRNFPLQNAMGGGQIGSASNSMYTNSTFAALVMCIQGVVALEECLPPEQVMHAATAIKVQPHTPTKSKVKGKGKRDKIWKACSESDTPEEGAPETPPTAHSEVVNENARKGLYPVYSCSAMFISELFQRCTNKDLSSEYRSLCTAIVGELLNMIQLPTFPGAALLLEHMLIQVLKWLSPSDSTFNSKRDNGFVVYLLDILGVVCTGLRRIILTAEREEKSAQSFLLSPIMKTALKNKVDTLKHGWSTLSRVQDSVKNSRKGTKEINTSDSRDILDVGIALRALLEVTASTVDVLCDTPACLNQEGEDGVTYSTALSALPSPVAILEQLSNNEEILCRFPSLALVDLQCFHICAYLNGQQNNNAYACTLALWYANAVTGERTEVSTYVASLIKQQTALHKSQSYSPASSTNAFALSFVPAMVVDADNSTRSTYSEEAVLSVSRAVLVARSGSSIFERVLCEILSLSMDPQPIVRAKAIRVLSPLLQSDNDLIQRDMVREALTSRLYDRAISVREESVKLLGYYVVRGYANLSADYLDGLRERLDDEGISVRKSVVLLFKEILLNQPDHPQYTTLCQALLFKASHPKEEESIKEIIQLTFQQIWFLPPSTSVVQTSQRIKLSSSSLRLASSDDIQNQDVGGDSCGNLAVTAAVEFTSAGHSPRTPTLHNQEAAINTPSTQTPRLSRSSSLGMGTPSNSANPRVPKTEFKSSTVLTSPKLALQEHIRSTALQLVDLTGLGEAADWMMSLLRELLHGASEGVDTAAQLKQRRAGSFAYCEKIVSCLVDLLLCIEEEHSEIMQLLASKGKDARTQATNIIHTIAIFCQAHPPFISRHLNTLLPYLKQDNRYTREQNALITLKVTEILSSSTQLDAACFGFDVPAVVADLKRCALNQSGKSIKAAVNCLAALAANVTNDATPIFQLADTCFRGIKSIATAVPDASRLNPGHIGNLQRLLIVFGYICECSRKCPSQLHTYANTMPASAISSTMKRLISTNKADATIAMQDISSIESLHPITIYGACYSAAVYALTVPVPAVQIRGAQALCGVFSGCPRLMLLAQEEGLLGALLGVNYDDAVHERFLVSLKEMMVVEEERLATEQALKQMKESGVAVIERDAIMSNPSVDAESTIPGFALQQHFLALTGFLSHTSSNLRLATLQLVGTLLRQGMLSPLDVIAPLIAMQGDSDCRISEEALIMLQVVDERHPTFLGNRMLDGVEQCYSFQNEALGECRVTRHAHGNSDDTSVLAGFYRTCILHPKRRREFLDGLLGRCFNLLSKLREQVSLHCGSYESLLQEQAQQKMIEDAAAVAAADATMSATSKDADGKSGLVGRGLVRKPSYLSITSSKSVTIQASVSQLLQLIDEGNFKPAVGEFIVSTLAYLPFDTIEEPLQLIFYINRNIAVGTSLLLHRLKQQFLSMGGELRKMIDMPPPQLGTRPKGSKVTVSKSPAELKGDGEFELVLDELQFEIWLETNNFVSAEMMSTSSTKESNNCRKMKDLLSSAVATVAQVRVVELLLIALQLRCNEAILRLKSYLKTAFSLSDERCLAYSPENSVIGTSGDRPSIGAVASFQALPKMLNNLTVSDISANFTNLPEKSANSTAALVEMMRTIASDYNRITHVLNEDPSDFALTAGTTSKKRKGKPAGVSRSSSGNSSGNSNNSSPVKVKKKVSRSQEEPVRQSPRKKPRRISSTGNDSSSGEDAGAIEDGSDDEDWKG